MVSSLRGGPAIIRLNDRDWLGGGQEPKAQAITLSRVSAQAIGHPTQKDGIARHAFLRVKRDQAVAPEFA